MSYFKPKQKSTFLAIFVMVVLLLGQALLGVRVVGAAGLTATGVKVVDVGKSWARIAWDTPVAATNQIVYGVTTSYGQISQISGYFTHHVWMMTGLAPSTLYHFCPNSIDGSGNSVTCNGTTNDYTVTTGPNTSAVPELPRAYVDTTMPTVNGQTFNVSADCSDLQQKMDAAAAADGTKTHQVLIPAGAVCSGAFTAKVKSAGSGWIIVRTSTPDSQLPAPGTRITPAQLPLMATILDTGWTNAYSAPDKRSGFEPCVKEQFWSGFMGYGLGFDVAKCDTVTSKFVDVPYTSGTTVPATCNQGDWFYKTDEPANNNRNAWYCITPNKFTNMAFVDDNGVKSGLMVAPNASHYRFVGLEFTHANTPSYAYRKMDYYYMIHIDKTADHIIVDRSYIHGLGAPTKTWGGIQMEGSYVALVDSYLDNLTSWQDFYDNSAGIDNQSRGISVSYGPGPGKISNNFLSAIGITAMFDDEGIASFGPIFGDYEVRNNYFYRDDKYRNGTGKVYPNPTSSPGQGPAYDGNYYDVRQLFELKAGRRFLLDGNILDGNWTSITQGAAMAFSPRPGNNQNPPDNIDTQISDVTITNNIIKNVPTGIGIWGVINQPATMLTSRIKITNNLFSNINGYLDANPGAYPFGTWGADFYLLDGPEDITINHNTFYRNSGTDPALILGSTGLSPEYPGSGLTVQDNILSITNRGYQGTVGYGTVSLNTDWKQIPNPSWIFDHNILAGPYATGGGSSAYPSGNYFPASESAIGFANAAGGDFSLSGASPYKSQGTGNSDPGVNMTALIAATANTLTGGGSSTPPPPPPPPPPPTPDVTPPTVSITSPGAGTVSGNITFSATASDPTVSGAVTSGLFLTSLLIDGSVVATSTSGSMSKTIDTTTLTNASHSLTARAQDNAGNITNTSATTITVNNASAPKFPRQIQLTGIEGISSIPADQPLAVFVLSGSNFLHLANLTPTAGQYTVTFLSSDPQLVDIRVYVPLYLSTKLTGIDTTVNSQTVLTFPTLYAGDFNNDGSVNTLDYSVLNTNWNKNYPNADIVKDGIINSLDFAILKNNWNKYGQ